VRRRILQSTLSAVYCNLLVNFGPQLAAIGPEFRHPKNYTVYYYAVYYVPVVDSCGISKKSFGLLQNVSVIIFVPAVYLLVLVESSVQWCARYN